MKAGDKKEHLALLKKELKAHRDAIEKMSKKIEEIEREILNESPYGIEDKIKFAYKGFILEGIIIKTFYSNKIGFYYIVARHWGSVENIRVIVKDVIGVVKEEE